MEKIYAITFMEYTNYEKTSIRNSTSDGPLYLNIPRDAPFLVRESEMLALAKYGGGIRTMECVGYLYDVPKSTTITSTSSNSTTAEPVENYLDGTLFTE